MKHVYILPLIIPFPYLVHGEPYLRMAMETSEYNSFQDTEMFNVQIRDRQDYFTLQCNHKKQGEWNVYDKSDTKTRWKNTNWHPIEVEGRTEPLHRLHYQRESYYDEKSEKKGTSYGGRCETDLTSILAVHPGEIGTVEFSARIYIHKNVLNADTDSPSSTGVFAIVLFGHENDELRWDDDYEFCLAVINLSKKEESTPQIKWGWANHDTLGMDLADVIDRWLIIKSIIKDDPKNDAPNRRTCLVTIRDQEVGMKLLNAGKEEVSCSLPVAGDPSWGGATKGRIIVNSRGRDPHGEARFENPEDDTSMVDIDWIKWEKH